MPGDVEEHLRAVEKLGPRVAPVTWVGVVADSLYGDTLPFETLNDVRAPSHMLVAEEEHVDVALEVQSVPVSLVVAQGDVLARYSFLSKEGLEALLGHRKKVDDALLVEAVHVPRVRACIVDA